MGVEVFLIRLRGGAGTFAEVDAFVRALPHHGPGSGFMSRPTYHAAGDGFHVVELEVADDTPAEVSMRYTLCHPPTVDAVFIDLARRLVERFGMDVFIAAETRPEHEGWFPPDRFADFAAAVPEYAAAERAMWHAMFGPDEFPATSPELSRWLVANFSADRR